MDGACKKHINVEETSAQKKEVSSLQRICLVCGDKALGYNFNAVSCDSCKAFFRRNALKSKKLTCPFFNNCKITIVTRRFCQKCRLEKCFSIGMVKESIMTEEDKAEMRRKIEENRAKKRQLTNQDDGVTSSKTLRRDEEGTHVPQVHESVLQCDVLNSTTISPNSINSMQSPQSTDPESS